MKVTLRNVGVALHKCTGILSVATPLKSCPCLPQPLTAEKKLRASGDTEGRYDANLQVPWRQSQLLRVKESNGLVTPTRQIPQHSAFPEALTFFPALLVVPQIEGVT